MSDKLREIRVVVVAFRVAEENSVGYVKLQTPDDPKLGATINRMIHDGRADFISIRAVDKGATA